jgi:hypothetical protein
MTRTITTISLIVISISAAVISGCTRVERSKWSSPQDAVSTKEQSPYEIDQLLDELDNSLLGLEETLATSEAWSLDRP